MTLIWRQKRFTYDVWEVFQSAGMEVMFVAARHTETCLSVLCRTGGGMGAQAVLSGLKGRLP
ncbi:hypothetical protein GMO_09720 [Gluconobacter morbifer G707]|uniref:Uncharacterized protein n=1 Tax=Gluconobacter morbifer G707 TaxID=1088869 RepID=G6XHK6_9PROT|nr:hypothetical protein GMO_09720 [Gluconobacter morbifer G707]